MLTKIIEWMGACFGILGALCVAAMSAKLGYMFFLTSSILLAFLAYRERRESLLVLQCVFMITNVIGLINYS